MWHVLFAKIMVLFSLLSFPQRIAQNTCLSLFKLIKILLKFKKICLNSQKPCINAGEILS